MMLSMHKKKYNLHIAEKFTWEWKQKKKSFPFHKNMK